MDASIEDSPRSIAINASVVHQVIAKVLQRKGMFAAEAEIVAQRMIEADQGGSDCDGVASLPEFLEAMDLGEIDPRARMIALTDTPAIAILDGGTGIGHVVATRAMEMAIAKSSSVGTGIVVVKHGRPGGDLRGIARLAANVGAIGLVTTSLNHVPDPVDNVSTPAIGRMAWSIPGPSGLPPLVGRDTTAGSDLWMDLFSNLLSAGLAGVGLVGRKRKSLRTANAVEYFLAAINPGAFGTATEIIEKWRPLWSSDAADQMPESQAIKYSAANAQLIADMARKVKLSVTW